MAPCFSGNPTPVSVRQACLLIFCLWYFTYPAGDGPLLLIYFLEQRLSALCILIYSTSIALPPAVIFCTSNKIFSSLKGHAQAITNGMLVRGTY